MATLLLSSRSTGDNQRLWRAAIARGWDVERCVGHHVPESLPPAPYVIYHEALFVPLLASRLGLSLVDPPEDWLARLPYHYALRDIEFTTMGKARLSAHPQFVKPPNDKSFVALVYPTGNDLPSDPVDSSTVLISEPVVWQSEFRCFIRDQQLLAISIYMRSGIFLEQEGFEATADEIGSATAFVQQLLSDQSISMPKAVVVDVGEIKGRGWAVIELNPAYSSGLYGCDPDGVLEVLEGTVQSV